MYGLEQFNLPASLEVTPLLTKLENAEKEYSQQNQHQDDLMKNVRLIELDPYHHHPQCYQQQSNASTKTRLFLLVAYGRHVVLAQLVALELSHFHDYPDALSDGEREEDLEDDELEWIDVSSISVQACNGHEISEITENGDDAIGALKDDYDNGGLVVIFPPSRADSLPYRDLLEKHPGLRGTNGAYHKYNDAKNEIVTCALIPSPSIRLSNESERVLTHRSVSVVLGMSDDRVLCFTLHVSEIAKNAISNISRPSVSFDVDFARVKFALEYGTCRNFEQGDESVENTKDATTNKSMGPPFIRCILPLQENHGYGEGIDRSPVYWDGKSERNDFSNVNLVAGDSPVNEITNNGKFNDVLGPQIQVFQPILSPQEGQLGDLHEAGGNVEGKADVEPAKKGPVGISSIVFYRGSHRWQDFEYGLKADTNQENKVAFYQDFVWITLGNGSIVNVPSWKFFLSFDHQDEEHKNGPESEGLNNMRTFDDANGVDISYDGTTVIPLKCRFQSPLDAPLPPSNRSNLSIPSQNIESDEQQRFDSMSGNADVEYPINVSRSKLTPSFDPHRNDVHDEFPGVASRLDSESSQNNEEKEDYWGLITSAILSQQRQKHFANPYHRTSQKTEALILAGQSSVAPFLPLSFQSSRVKCTESPMLPKDESSTDGLAMQSNENVDNRNDDDDYLSYYDSAPYGPVTGTVVGGTAALVRGALGVALGAVRWGLGRSAIDGEQQPVEEKEESKEPIENDDIRSAQPQEETNNSVVSGEFVTTTGKHIQTATSAAFLAGTPLSKQSNGSHTHFSESEETKDLFPWPLSGVSFAYSDLPRRFLSATVDPSGSLAATTDSLGRVMLFDLETRQPIRMWKGMRNVSCYFAELPRSIHGFCENGKVETWLYLVIHLRQRGTVEVYRLRQGSRVTAAAVPQHDDCVVIECYGPMSEGGMARCFLLEKILEPDGSDSVGRKFMIDYLVVDDCDALIDTKPSQHIPIQPTSQNDSKMQLTLLMQLLAPDTNISCNFQAILTSFKHIKALADLSEGLDLLSKCNQLEDGMGADGSSFHSQAVAYCKSRLHLARETESHEGSGMVRKAAISELSSKVAYHERLIRAYDILHSFELKNGGHCDDIEDAEEGERKILSSWASEAVTWISATGENDTVRARFSPSLQNMQKSGDDNTALQFSKFAISCSAHPKKNGNPTNMEHDHVVYLTGVRRDRILLLSRIFRPLLRDMFVFKVVNSIFVHLGIHEDFETLQEYFGEWFLTLPTLDIVKSNLSGVWRPMVRWLQDLILSAHDFNELHSDDSTRTSLNKTVKLEALLTFCMDVDDLPKAFLLAVICLDAVSVISKQIEEKTYGKITQLESIRPWEELLRKLRVCLLVSIRLAGDICPVGGAFPLTVKSASSPGTFSTYSWIARDELTLSHSNEELMVLENACLSSSEAFYPSTIDGDSALHKKLILQTCDVHRPVSSLRAPIGLNNEPSRPLLFYLRDHATCPAHLAAHRALILGGLWGLSPNNLQLLKDSLSSLRTVLDQCKEFSLAICIELYQSRIRPVCRAMIFGFDDVHELSADIVAPLMQDSVWLHDFVTAAKQILSMINKCCSIEFMESIQPDPKDPDIPDVNPTDVDALGMWPPLREDPVLKTLVSKLRQIQISSVETHHVVIFAFGLTRDASSLQSIVPSFSRLFLIQSLFCEMPATPQGSTQQRDLLNKAIVEHANNHVGPVVDHIDMKDIELVGRAWGLDFKYVRTRYFIEMIRLGKDANIDDLLGSSIASLDRSVFVEEMLHIICVRLDATITSLKRVKNYRGIVSLLDADASHYVRDVAKQSSASGNRYAHVSLITTHTLVLRTQNMCEHLNDDSKRRKIDGLCLLSGILLKAVQEQEAVNI